MANSEDAIKYQNDLIGKSAVSRRKAAIYFRAHLAELDCKYLEEAIKIDRALDNWQTKVELLKTAGFSNCKSLANYIKSEFVLENNSLILVKMAASTCYIRLTRSDLSDVKGILELLTLNDYSVTEGALEALGYDKMVPSIVLQNEIINICSDFGKDRPKGFTDPRYGLAAACAGWDKNTTKEFLEICVQSDDTPLKYVSENALKGKYVKLR